MAVADRAVERFRVLNGLEPGDQAEAGQRSQNRGRVTLFRANSTFSPILSAPWLRYDAEKAEKVCGDERPNGRGGIRMRIVKGALPVAVALAVVSRGHRGSLVLSNMPRSARSIRCSSICCRSRWWRCSMAACPAMLVRHRGAACAGFFPLRSDLQLLRLPIRVEFGELVCFHRLGLDRREVHRELLRPAANFRRPKIRATQNRPTDPVKRLSESHAAGQRSSERSYSSRIRVRSSELRCELIKSHDVDEIAHFVFLLGVEAHDQRYGR